MNRLALSLPLSAAAALFATGCLDLSFPNPNSSDRLPVITFISPQAGQLVPLSYFVSLDVQDAAGINLVQLLCGGVVLNTWSTAPYQSQVDLHPCKSVAEANPDGGLATVTLTATAIDPLGHSATQLIEILLDASAPSLTLSLPGRIPPGGTLQFGITSDRPLTGNPVVQVGGVDAVVASASDGGTQSFIATFSPVPQIGVDAFDAGGTPDADVPLNVLTEIERPIGVSVDGRGVNDNVTHIDAQVLISRIAWEVQIPGLPLQPGFTSASVVVQRALATDGGLYLPINTDPSYAFIFPWTPGFFAAGDGAFSPFLGSVNDLVNAGFTPQGLSSDGDFIVTTDGGSLGYFLDVQLLNLNGQQMADGPGVWLGDPSFPLTNVGSVVCQEQFDAGTVFACTTPPMHELGCIGRSGPFLTPVFGNDPNDSSTSASTLTVNSGGNYLGVTNGAACTPFTETSFVGTPTQSLSMNLSDVANTPARLLPTGNTSFAAGFFAAAIHMNPQGILDNKLYFRVPRGANAASQLIAARSDDTAIRIFPDPPFTNFAAYAPLPVTDPDAGVPVSLGRIPEALIYPSFSFYSEFGPVFSALPVDVVVHPSGAVTVLLAPGTSDTIFLVAHLDAQMRPRWLYQYPRTLNLNGYPQLVADPEGDLIYFIDVTNLFVVALRP